MSWDLELISIPGVCQLLVMTLPSTPSADFYWESEMFYDEELFRDDLEANLTRPPHSQLLRCVGYFRYPDRTLRELVSIKGTILLFLTYPSTGSIPCPGY